MARTHFLTIQKENWDNMDLKSIKEIVCSDVPEYAQERLILSVLAQDKKVIPYIMEILKNERDESSELLLDTNSELGRALATLITCHNSLRKNKMDVSSQVDFVINEIKKHYKKWKGSIGCCIKVDGVN